jgi:hypothetical protein
MSQQNEIPEELTETGDARVDAAGAAMAAAGEALLALLLALVTLIGRVLQAAFILARFALYPICAGAAVIGGGLMFNTTQARYGGDVFAVILALALTVIVPATLLVLAHDTLPIWPLLLASGLISLLAHILIIRAPPLVLAPVPAIILSACVLHFTLNETPNQNSAEGEKTNEQQE